jgi:S-adenosylmethionine decarboxylase
MKKTNIKYHGIHLIGDLYDCQLDNFLINDSEIFTLQKDIEDIIKSFGFIVLGSYFHFFGCNAATGVIALAESHVSFHTWPEESYVSIDIFVCNFSKDNTQSANKLFDLLSLEIFKSGKIKKQIIKR